MKRAATVFATLACLGIAASSVKADYLQAFDFETGWAGDYAPGWVNTDYRHGAPPVGKMMQQVSQAHSGSYGMKLTADSTPESWMWWASVSLETVNPVAIQKQYDPYVSVWYYDDQATGVSGQVMAVPSWVNPYLAGGEDWTDIQFGARFNQPITGDYFYVAAGENSPGWQDTGVARSAGWVNLKMQLSSADGRVHFYVDGVEVAQSYRNDYTDLGSTLGLYTMFQNPLSNWGDEKPFTVWDDFAVGSSFVPLPAAAWAGMMLLGGLGGMKTLKRMRRQEA